MGLFGKKKTPEEILAEGRAQYVKGDLKKSFITLHGLAAKGNPQACYYVGRIYLERKEKNLAQSFLTTAAKGGVQDAAALLAREFGIRDYLPGETTPKSEIVSDSVRKADAVPSVDDLLDELEETEAFIQDTKRELKQAEEKVMGRTEESLRPKPQTTVEKPIPPVLTESVSVPIPKPEPEQKTVLKQNRQTDAEISPEEKYQKGMELFKAGNYAEAYEVLKTVCKVFYLSRSKNKNIYPAGQAALGWMCETGNGTEMDIASASMYYHNAVDNATGIPDKNGMAGFVRLTVKAENPSLKDCEAALNYAKQLGTGEAKAAVSILEKKLAEAQLREKYAEWELNETNVQEIFNRCLENKDTISIARAQLFLINMGYDGNEDVPIHFDKALLLENKRNIEYLYGQLYSVYAGVHFMEDQSIEDFFKTYTENYWTREQACVLMLLYLGATSELPINIPFSKERNNTTRISRHITPTLSPKDLNFPSWWEAHKSEWEG